MAINPLLNAPIAEEGDPITIVMLSKNGCVQCTALERKLNKDELPYHMINIEELETPEDTDVYREYIGDTYGNNMPLTEIRNAVTGEVISAFQGNRPDVIAKITSQIKPTRGVVQSDVALAKLGGTLN